MVLYMIGLGLGNERDITLRGLDAVQRCSKACTRTAHSAARPLTCAAQVYLEAYTSILGVDKEKLVREGASDAAPHSRSLTRPGADQEALYGKPVEIADRECVEQARACLPGSAGGLRFTCGGLLLSVCLRGLTASSRWRSRRTWRFWW